MDLPACQSQCKFRCGGYDRKSITISFILRSNLKEKIDVGADDISVIEDLFIDIIADFRGGGKKTTLSNSLLWFSHAC